MKSRLKQQIFAFFLLACTATVSYTHLTLPTN